MAEIDDVAQLQVVITVEGQQMVNTFHVRRNPTAGSTDGDFLQTLLNDSNTLALMNLYKPMLQTGDTVDRIWARQVPDPQFPDAERWEGSRTLALAGTRSATNKDVPLPVCALVKLGTDKAGRRYHGRIFAPPMKSAVNLSGGRLNLGGDYAIAVNAFLVELAKTMFPSGGGHYAGAWNDLDLCIYSLTARRLDAANIYYARCTAAQLDPVPRFLRSRRPK